MNGPTAHPAGLPLHPPRRGGGRADIDPGRWWFAYGWDTRSGPLRRIVPDARSAGAARAEGWAAAFTLSGVTARPRPDGFLPGRLWSLPSRDAAEHLLAARIPGGRLTEIDVVAGRWHYRAAMAVTAEVDDNRPFAAAALSGTGGYAGRIRGLWRQARRSLWGRSSNLSPGDGKGRRWE